MRKLLLILTAVIMLSCVEPTNNNDFEKSVIRAELPTQADVPNSQPQAESNNDLTQTEPQAESNNDLTPTEPQTENNNPQEQPEPEIIIEPQQEQPTQPEEEYNYLMPDKNFNLNDYVYDSNFETAFFRYWINKNGAVIVFNNGSFIFEYWDGVNNIYGRQPSGALNKSTMKGTFKKYKTKDGQKQFILGEVENDCVFFTEYKFVNVPYYLNAYDYDLYLGKVQFVNKTNNGNPQNFID